MKNLSHQDKLVKGLQGHMSNDEIKRFSEELRNLGIANLREPQVAEKLITPEGSALLFSLVTFSKTGILDKLIEIKGLIK